MAPENKHKKLDIMSKLIDMQLEHIAGDILANLSDVDIANAVAANPKWSAIATGRGRINKIFSKNKAKTAPLKTFYRREELLAPQTHDSIGAPSLFRKACANCVFLGQTRVKQMKRQEDFRLVAPLESTFLWYPKCVNLTDRFIVTLFGGAPKASRRNERKWNIQLVQLFDRWTFQLVNAFTVNKCYYVELQFFEDHDIINAALVIMNMPEKQRAFFWDLTTGKLHALLCPAAMHEVFYIGKLIVLLWADGEQLNATVYKVQAETDSVLVICIVNDEPLHASKAAQAVRSAAGLDCFAICVNVDWLSDLNAVLQMRSKEDFSLIRVVTGLGHSPMRSYNSFMFNEWFAFVFNREELDFIGVVSLVDGDLRTVYRFCVPDEVKKHPYANLGRASASVGRFLVFEFSYGGGFYAVLWKLPLDFVETCRRHLGEGTIGVTEHCDQLIFEKSLRRFDPKQHHRTYVRFDRFGFLKCYVYYKKSQLCK